jgi:hypothetical protein
LLTYGAKHWPQWQFRLLAALIRLEAAVRQRWAHWRRDPATASLFGVLGKIARDVNAGAAARARKRLIRVLGPGRRRKPRRKPTTDNADNTDNTNKTNFFFIRVIRVIRGLVAA